MLGRWGWRRFSTLTLGHPRYPPTRQASFGLLSYYTGSLRGPILFVACALLGAGVLALAYRHDYGAPRHDAEEEVEAPLQGPVVT